MRGQEVWEPDERESSLTQRGAGAGAIRVLPEEVTLEEKGDVQQADGGTGISWWRRCLTDNCVSQERKQQTRWRARTSALTVLGLRESQLHLLQSV